MELKETEVHFDIWCKSCAYAPKEETKDPCNYCLDFGSNMGTTKPVMWKEKQ